MGIYSALATLENAFYSASKAPTVMYCGHKQKKALTDPEYLDKLKSKEEKKETEKEMRKSERSAQKSGKEEIQENVKSDINSLNHKITEERKYVLLEKAQKAQKLINFVDYYYTNKDAKLVNFKQNEKEFINAVSEIYGFNKLYPDCLSANLKAYDLSYKDEYLFSGKYLVSIKDLETNAERIKKSSQFVNRNPKKAEKEEVVEEVKTEESKESVVTEATKEETVKPPTEETKETTSQVEESTGEDRNRIIWQTDENGIVHPIFFTKKSDEKMADVKIPIKPEEPIKPFKFFNTVPDEIIRELDEKLSEFIGNAKHRYEYHNSLIVALYITRNNIEERFLIDPNGYVTGAEKIYVMGNLSNGNQLFVSIDHKDLVKKILSSKDYIMSPDEYQIAISDQFANANIYRYIDMSNTGFLSDIPKEEYDKLGKKLSFIINKMAENNSGNMNLPRLRFLSWNNVNDFKLISDDSIRVPLEGVSADLICNGLTFTVNNDEIIEYYNGTERHYSIEKYGEM